MYLSGTERTQHLGLRTQERVGRRLHFSADRELQLYPRKTQGHKLLTFVEDIFTHILLFKTNIEVSGWSQSHVKSPWFFPNNDAICFSL